MKLNHIKYNLKQWNINSVNIRKKRDSPRDYNNSIYLQLINNPIEKELIHELENNSQQLQKFALHRSYEIQQKVKVSWLA